MGHFVPWAGGCLLVGRAGAVIPVHAHYAIQIAFGSVPGIRFRGSDRDHWTEYAGAVIPSRQPHGMDATEVQPNAVLFVEPETREGRALAERYGGAGVAAIPGALLADVAPALFAAWQAAAGRQSSVQVVVDAARRVVHVLAGETPPSVVSDGRVLRAVSYINAHLDAPLTLGDIAAEACLSPSRFRHLFVEETGMALRPYILWRRFLRAWELLMTGSTLSAAAHAAGFADASHLTRTSRRMFGFPPSSMRLVGPLPTGAGDTVEAHLTSGTGAGAEPVAMPRVHEISLTQHQPLRSIVGRDHDVPYRHR